MRLAESVLVFGCVDDEPDTLPVGLKLLGKLADTPELVRTQRVDDVIMALPASCYLAVETLVYALLTLPVRLGLVAQSSVESMGGNALIGLREPGSRGIASVVKRTFDMLTSGVLLVNGWPAKLIALASPGAVIFK